MDWKPGEPKKTPKKVPKDSFDHSDYFHFCFVFCFPCWFDMESITGNMLIFARGRKSKCKFRDPAPPKETAVAEANEQRAGLQVSTLASKPLTTKEGLGHDCK